MILLIEDRPASRKALAELLRNFGYEVLEAENGTQAFALLKREPIKLIITDFVLPDVDGMKLIQLVKLRSPTMPIVLISGYMSQQTGDAFADTLGPRTRYFTKPVEPSILDAVIQSLLAAA